MGNWVKQIEIAKEHKEKDKVRKEKLAGYFFDLSKLSFAGLVIVSSCLSLQMWGIIKYGVQLL